MKLYASAFPCLSVFILVGCTNANAQIDHPITANITHKFVIGNTTLPAGKYMFRMEGNTDLMVMEATNQSNDTSVQFMVRQSTDEHRPSHTELVFRKYGNDEFLSKMYLSGSRAGAAVAEPSRLEERLKKEGQKAAEHTEEQQ